MKITAVETLRLQQHSRLLWVIVRTDEGVSGWGETYDKAGPAKTAVHEVCAQFLLGRDPRDIEKIWHEMFTYIHYHGYAAAEMRAVSAIDTALWDILGKMTGQPIWRLLGGRFRDRIPLYATCVERSVSLRRGEFSPEKTLETAVRMIERGFPRIKIDPFHSLADKSAGGFLARADLSQALAEVAILREHLGDTVEIAIDAHAAWTLPCAMEIAHGLEPYHPMFLEEPLLSDDIESLAALARSTTIPLCESERLFTRWQFKPLLDRRAAAIAMPDLAWTGGISETRKIADLAAVMSIPIAPHNCGGPGTFLATAHVCTVVPNLFCLESVPEFVEAFYDELVVRPLAIADGMITPPELPGLGNELRPELFKRSDAEYEVRTEPSPWGKSSIHKSR